jgi:hypothetical protein
MRSERLSWSGPIPHKVALGALGVGSPLLGLGLLFGRGTVIGYVLSAVASGGVCLALFVALFLERREHRTAR